jgi:chloramphenicol O-acetyltransferase type A
MQQPIIVRKQKIDLETWERNAIFSFFRGFSEPYHGVCIRVDCTATYNFAKGQGLSLFLSLLHRSLAAAQQVENFRTRIVDGAVWRYEEVNGGSAVGRPNGTIGFAHYRYRERSKNSWARLPSKWNGCAGGMTWSDTRNQI